MQIIFHFLEFDNFEYEKRGSKFLLAKQLLIGLNHLNIAKIANEVSNWNRNETYNILGTINIANIPFNKRLC